MPRRRVSSVLKGMAGCYEVASILCEGSQDVRPGQKRKGTSNTAEQKNEVVTMKRCVSTMRVCSQKQWR